MTSAPELTPLSSALEESPVGGVSPAEIPAAGGGALTPPVSVHASRRIQDMPADERPREKMLRHGPGALSDAELLALFFRTGTRDLSAIDIGRTLLRKYGSLTALSRRSVNEIQKQKGLGPAKALDLAAAVELGKRLARQEVSCVPLDSPESIYDLVGPEMRSESQEVLKVILLTPRCTLISIEEITRGTVSETIAHPREILRAALVHCAHAFIMVHNHPSGDPSPSSADITLTRRIREAASLMQISFHDHVIIGSPCANHPSGHYSFRQNGIL